MEERLAMVGGAPVTREPFPAWPQLPEKALAEALDTLKSGRLTYWAGPKGREFESKWAEWAGVPYAVSCSSGTAALHIALLALGMGPGDEVIVPSHSFIATASAVASAGATPVFCDVREDHTIDARKMESLVSARTRAVIAVHLYGVICDMGAVLQAARARGLRVIEDCAQSVGGEYRAGKTGTLGDIGCFSFSQGKHLTTGGEGGMAVTADETLAWELRSLRDQGYDAREWLDLPAGAEQPPAPHRRLGLNYRMTEVQSAIGLAELVRLDTWNLPRRVGYARMYDHAFGQLYGVKALPFSSDQRKNAYWQYPLELDPGKLTCGVEEFHKALAAEGVPCSRIRWREAYQEPVFGARTEPICPVAQGLRERTVLLCLHPSWERSHIDLCIAAVKKVLRAFRR